MNTTKQALSYRELQTELKTYKAQGLTQVSLNSAYDVLEKELQKLMAYKPCGILADVIDSEEDKIAEAKAEVQIADHMDFANWNTVSSAKRQSLVNALNFRLSAYGITLADSIHSVAYNPSNQLWQIKYFNRKSELSVEILYDSDLVNCLTQTKDIPVFEPMEELLDTVSALREEFAGIKVILSGQKAIINFGSLALTFLARENQLIFCTRAWDCGNSWVTDNVDRTYRNHSQIQGLKAQLRSDFWFDLEVLEVA